MYNQIFGVVNSDTSAFMIISNIFIICFIGSFVGAITGLGGGMIIKPMFGSALQMTSHIGNLVAKFMSTSVVFTMSSKSSWYYKKQKVSFDYKLGMVLGIGIIAGILAVMLVGNILFALEILLQGILYFIVFLVVLFRDKYPKCNYRNNVVVILLIGFVIGFLSSFFGIGGGAIKIPFFIVFFSMSVKEAAIYSFFASMISEPVKLFQYGFDIFEFNPMVIKIALLGALVAGVAAIIGGSIGVKIQNKASEKFIANFFNVVIVYFAFESVVNGILLMNHIIVTPLSIFQIIW